MAAEFRISVEMGHLLPAHAPLTRDVFPALSAAVERIAAAAQHQWVRYASGEALPDGKVIRNRTGEYARSILLRQLGDFSAEVFSDLAYAHAIEAGAPARDLKRILFSSLKVRLTHDGRRYLIIPFRWNRPGSVLGHAMPESVKGWWQGRTASSITGTYRRASGTGAFDIKTRERVTVPGWRYSWGDRLSADDLKGLGVHGRAVRHMEGMVNFRNPGAGATGTGAHSQYITFRVMVEGSPGWMMPAQEGRWPARKTADLLRPVAEQAFQRAMEEDIAHIVGGTAAPGARS